MNKQLVLYHASCPDGFTAAYCAWRKFGDAADYEPVRYGQSEPDVTGRDVLIVDFSYKRDVLLEMASKAASLRVLDHHKTAEADLVGLDFCLFDMNRSGAGITYDELHLEREGTRTALVSYIEDRDLWRFALPQSKEVNAYIGTFDYTFEQWHALDNELARGAGVPRAAEMGALVLRNIDRYVQQMTKQARTRTVGGHSVLCVNAPHINCSELVGHMASLGDTFAVGWFQRQDGKYQYSLRSRGDFDVSEVAKMYGGGGHKNAAGFTVDERVDT